MTQNRTHAVMAQRHEAHDSLDDFPTPLWGTRAGVLHALCRSDVPGMPTASELSSMVAWEPCANRGYMVTPLREYFGQVIGTDVHDYGAGFETLDFLMPIVPAVRPDIVFANPPFRLAIEFVRRAMEVSRFGCVMLVRTTWTDTLGRYRLFQEHPPTVVAQFSERLAMVKGRLDRKASTATAYAWVVFLHSHGSDTRWRHIPPCRAGLDRDSDWPAVEPKVEDIADIISW